MYVSLVASSYHSRRVSSITRIVRTTIAMLTQYTARPRVRSGMWNRANKSASHEEGGELANLRIVKARISLTASSREVREMILSLTTSPPKKGSLSCREFLLSRVIGDVQTAVAYKSLKGFSAKFSRDNIACIYRGSVSVFIASSRKVRPSF